MEGQPLVSIVIPAYNAEKTLKRMLDSVTGQTWQNTQIILVRVYLNVLTSLAFSIIPYIRYKIKHYLPPAEPSIIALYFGDFAI